MKLARLQVNELVRTEVPRSAFQYLALRFFAVCIALFFSPGALGQPGRQPGNAADDVIFSGDAPSQDASALRQTEADGDAVARDEEPDDQLPTFRFRTSAIEQWLLLGPVPVDARPDNPSEFLEDIGEGKEVVFADGTRRKWTQGFTRELAYVALDSFCKAQKADSANSAVYAYCRIVAREDGVRKFSYGADDGSTVWVDGVEVAEFNNGWYDIDVAKFDLPFKADTPRNLLVEVRNKGGDFGFGFASGETWKGIATYENGVTPNPGVQLQVRDLANKEVMGVAVSDALGRLSFPRVPYEIEVGLFEGANQLEINWTGSDEDRQFQAATSAPKMFQKTNLLPADYVSSHPITSVACCPTTGVIYFVDAGARHRVKSIEGHRVSVFPGSADLPDDVGIVKILVGEQKRVFAQTEEYGLLCLSPDERFQFGAKKQLVGFNQVPTPPGIFVRKIDELETHQGVIWTMAGGISDDENPDDAPPYVDSATRIYSIDPGAMVAKEVVVHNGRVREFDVGDQGLIYGDAFALYHRQDLYQGEFEQQPIPVTGVQGIGYDASGRLFVLGLQALAGQDGAGEWQKVSHSPFTQLPCDLRCGGGVWVCNTQWVSRAEGGRLKVVETGEAWESSAEWGDDGLLVGTVGGRIIGVEPAAVQVVGLPEGLVLSGKTKVEIGGKGVLLSGKRMPLHMWSDGEISRLLGNESKIGVFLTDQHILRFPSMNAYDRSRINVKPVYHLYSSGEDLTRFELLTDAPYLQLESYTKLPSGKLLLATNRGLFEIGIHGSRLESHQTPERPFALTAVDILDGGAVWIGDGNGRFCKLRDSSEDRNWKALPGTTRQQVTHFGQANIDGQDVVLIGTKTGLYAYDEQEDECRLVDAPFKDRAFIQDIEMAPDSDDVMVSVRNIGVYLLREGVWAKVDLGEAVPTNMVWDIEYESEGAYWLTTSEWYARVQRREREFFCYVEVTNSSNERVAPAEGPFEVEKDTVFQAKLSVSNPFGQAGYRYRQSEGQWKYLAVSDGVLQIRPSSPGLLEVEVQAFDHDLNFSSSVYVPIDVFLPWWRWRIVRWATVLFAVGALAITIYSVQQSRRSRKARVAAERQTAQIERERRALAEQGAKERERLLLRVCHDLKNPLNVVFACTEMLGSGELAPDDAASLLTGSAESMDYLSKQLLSYSKAKRRGAAEKSYITVQTIFEELRRESLILDRGNLRELEVQVDADTPLQLYSDAQALKEILRNLLDNAVKHCPEGTITLRFVMRNDLPTFVVEDTGAGMPAAELEAIFDAFYQLANRANQRDGLGLGLAICKSLAEMLGGQLNVASKLGEGSQFSLELSQDSLIDPNVVADMPHDELGGALAPHFAPEGSKSMERDMESVGLLKSKGSILVVDDMEYVGTTVVQLLQKLGQEAEYVRPVDSVETATDAVYSIVLVDLNMQGIDGFGVAKQLRERRGDSICIVAMSENEQLIEVAKQTPMFDQTLPKTRLFEILGRSKAASF